MYLWKGNGTFCVKLQSNFTDCESWYATPLGFYHTYIIGIIFTVSKLTTQHEVNDDDDDELSVG